MSAGRVQSVALRLVVDREREIQAFIPQEYWSLEAELKKKDGTSREEKKTFEASLDKIDGEKIGILSGSDVARVTSEIEGKDFVVASIEKNIKNRNPQPPFITNIALAASIV